MEFTEESNYSSFTILIGNVSRTRGVIWQVSMNCACHYGICMKMNRVRMAQVHTKRVRMSTSDNNNCKGMLVFPFNEKAHQRDNNTEVP
jgi:hypothetical protein